MEPTYRFWVTVDTTKQWYDIIRECNSWFGKNWKGQPHVKRKIKKHNLVKVWFDVPDLKFSSWISVKYSLEVHGDSTVENGK